MKEMNLSGGLKVIALNAVKNNPEGYKGLDKIRTGLKVVKILEKGLPVDQELTIEEREKQYKVVMEEVEFKLLKDCDNDIPWRGLTLELAGKLLDAIEEAKEPENDSSEN